MASHALNRARLARLLTLCSLAACALACGDDGGGSTPADAGSHSDTRPFRIVLEHLDGALMSVTGTSDQDVWAVGANTRDGDGALALHFDGQQWRRELTGVEADLWWAHAFKSDSMFFGGTAGTILRYDGEHFTKMTTPRSGQVYGVWGASEDDVWAVGGAPEVEPGFIWHFDGQSWSDMSEMLPEAVRGKSLFKAWGRSADDVWIVGLDGVAVHWDGSAFEQAETGTDERLFTVHGTASGNPAFVAVGGDAGGVLVQNDGTAWHKLAQKAVPTQLFGVYMQSAKHGYAVGYDGAVLEFNGKAWKLLDTAFALSHPLHSVWVDARGGVWAVGGDLDSSAPSDGVLVHEGNAISDEITSD